MKSRQKFKLVPRWDPEHRFAIAIQQRAPTARRAPEFLPEPFYRFDEGTWQVSPPLQ